MFNNMNYSHKCIHLLFLLHITHASILDYIPNVKTFWSSSITENQNKANDLLLLQNVPYEVELTDEKFIEQAATFTGIALSGLDKCQHRVIFKLKEECHKLNDEQLAKLAVKLLNCQSAIEGRKIYPCTDQMSLRDCTNSMDPDTWNSYLLMSNRARAVCYSIRQAQFRGLTELAVNKLMGAANEQLDIMTRLKDGQSKLEHATSETYQTVIQGNDVLKQQQDDIQQAQFYGQLALEDNIKRLADEKQLILEGYEQLTKLTKDVKTKLDEASEQIDVQSQERKENHREILNDLIDIQKQAQAIFTRIEDSSRHMLEQSTLAAQQYEATLLQLGQVNSSVHALVDVVSATRIALEEKLKWLSEALGGTDDAVERLYLFLSHIMYLIVAMVSCAFLNAPILPRIALITLVPLNLIVAIQQGSTNAFSFIGVTISLLIFTAVQSLFTYALLYWQKETAVLQKKAIECKKEAVEIDSETNENSNKSESQNDDDEDEVGSLYSNNINKYKPSNNSYLYRSNYSYRSDQSINDDFDNFVSPTPPSSIRSRSKTPQIYNRVEKHKCRATTRMGTPCRLTAVIGRDYCCKHQTGSSVIA